MDAITKQLESYSKKDIESFMACYHEDIKVYMLQSGQVLADGLDQLRQVMSQSFESDSEDARTEVLSSITQGNLVVNQERITGHTPGKIITTISIYELTDGLISKLWFGGRTVEEAE